MTHPDGSPAPLPQRPDRSAAQQARAVAFRELHALRDGFIMPNPWDAGSARLLAHLGFPALATTSAGFAFSRGHPDKSIPRELFMAHLADIAAATALPVSADLENGFGDAPEDVAHTIRLAAAAGAVGGSIEDSPGASGRGRLYARDVAAERVRAAAEAARSLPFAFTLTARAENYFIGQPDLADTIGRLQAYQEAGADVLYAPGLVTQEDISTVVRAVDRPVNVLIGVGGMTLTAADLAQLGVRRISVGGSLARAAYGELLRAAGELKSEGSTAYTQTAVSAAELNRLFGSWDSEA